MTQLRVINFLSHQVGVGAAPVSTTATSPALAVTAPPAPSLCASQRQTFVRSGQCRMNIVACFKQQHSENNLLTFCQIPG